MSYVCSECNAVYHYHTQECKLCANKNMLKSSGMMTDGVVLEISESENFRGTFMCSNCFRIHERMRCSEHSRDLCGNIIAGTGEGRFFISNKRPIAMISGEDRNSLCPLCLMDACRNFTSTE